MAARSGLSADRTIRPARATDIDGLARAHHAAFVAGNGPALTPDALARVTPERMRERWKAHLDDPPPGTLLLIAESGGEIVGIAASGPLRAEDGGDATTGGLYALYVDPRAWGAGHGGALLEASLAHLAASGFERAALWVLEDNARARSFYAARGWTGGGERREWEGATILRLAREL